MNIHSKLPAAALLSSLAVFAGCGGGGDDDESNDPSESQRIEAATETANNNANCAESNLGPFYWEVGDKDGKKASGSVGSDDVPTATTPMPIASASKWVYSTYVVEKVGNRDSDHAFLNFTSGYLVAPVLGDEGRPPTCTPGLSVEGCLEERDVGLEDDKEGRFFYDSGHMQWHAANVMGLGDLSPDELTAEVSSVVGKLSEQDGEGYRETALAAGITTTPELYAAFLRRILKGELKIKDVLGTSSVCATETSGCDAENSPIPTTATESSALNEQWRYSLGHWVENDPRYGDGAFSSAGALGFYPWIDKTKTTYGILARNKRASGSDDERAGYQSATCGRLIRQAWRTGVTVTATTPSP